MINYAYAKESKTSKMDEGKIKEVGTHEELIRLGGNYFSLVKNQLQMEELHASV